MKCVIHIGTEKTGTTLLQDWLYANRAELSKQRVYLSSILGMSNNRDLVSYFQQELDDWAFSKRISNQEEKAAYFENFESRFQKEVQAAAGGHDVFVITSEHFHSRLCTREEIEALCDFLKPLFETIEIVCYFREQSAMAQSLYSTLLRISMKDSLESYLSRVSPQDYYYDFKRIADNWSDVFGRSNCHFRIYDRDRFQAGDIRRDFLGCLDMAINADVLDFNIATANESLSFMQGELFKVINEKIPYWNHRNMGVNQENLKIKNVISSMRMLNHGKLAGDCLDVVFDRFVDTNQAFFDHYFDGEFLFVRPSSALSGSEEERFTLKRVTHMMTALMTHVLTAVPKSALYDDDANYLRDIALKAERSEVLTAEDAVKLLTLANRARPKGPLIKRKLEEFRKKLS
ncbi:hypothetical protein [uncultured Cohaesibacter sp.]|uniref:hypothetical protein n=1 Tax=uncultured Cohaesibacter sp. TaxID=1002546 RepID=UPI0029C7C6ED|nr:hypothetical protein [uncultured Cohaesibacter sp.]